MRLPKASKLGQDARYLQECDSKELFNPNPRNIRRYAYESRFKSMIELIAIQVRKNEFILDVGCAQGNFTLTLSRLGYYIVGLDIKPSFLKYVKMKAEKIEKENAGYIVADAQCLPIRSDIFGCLVLGEILEHVPEPKRVLLESRRVLTSFSPVIISTPNGERIETKSIRRINDIGNLSDDILKELSCKPAVHIFELSRKDLRHLLMLGRFSVQKLLYLNASIIFLIPLLLKLPIPIYVIRKVEQAILGLPVIGNKFATSIICLARSK